MQTAFSHLLVAERSASVDSINVFHAAICVIFVRSELRATNIRYQSQMDSKKGMCFGCE